MPSLDYSERVFEEKQRFLDKFHDTLTRKQRQQLRRLPPGQPVETFGYVSASEYYPVMNAMLEILGYHTRLGTYLPGEVLARNLLAEHELRISEAAPGDLETNHTTSKATW